VTRRWRWSPAGPESDARPFIFAVWPSAKYRSLPPGRRLCTFLARADGRMNLPPLRTVRDTPGPGVSPIPAATRPVLPCLSGNGVPKAVRDLVGELVGIGLLPTTAAEAFVRQAGPQLVGLATPAMVADALVGLKHLTRFQASRALAGQI